MARVQSSTTQPASNPPHTRQSTLAARVTAELRAALEHGVRPWVQPWSSTTLAPPLRANGQPYRGINILILWAAAQQRGFTQRQWCTYQQARQQGARVRRGERATQIVFYAPAGPRSEPTDGARPDAAPHEAAPSHGENETRRRAILRSYAVFNADQLDGWPAADSTPAPPIFANGNDATQSAAQAAIARIPAATQHGGDRAYYQPRTDTIHLPPPARFDTPAHYLATRLHECAHWSGHPSRLDRFPAHAPQDRTAYAREELIAELTAAFLGAELHLPLDLRDDHASYLDAWLKWLDHDPGALLTAAGRAQTAADYLRQFLQPEAPP